MSIHRSDHLPPHVAEAIKPILQNRDQLRPVSISAMLRATRYAVPNLALTDAVLAELLAAELIHHGCCIDFDSRVPPSVNPPLHRAA